MRARAGADSSKHQKNAMKILNIVFAAALGLAVGHSGSTAAAATQPAFNLDQAVSDGAQSTTLAFSGFGMLTGNLGAQSFFPPGKVADYWGFQFLRDNDSSDMGHNTSFLTRISSNMLYILDDTQLAQLKTLAKNQVGNINLYGWKRYPLMKAFRRLMDGNLPSGAVALNLSAVKAASKDMYLLDGQISYERAVVYAGIYRSLSTAQKAYLDAMVGKGYNDWPNKVEDDVRSKTQGLTNDEVVAVMTYAGDLYSWYAGSITADVYFCPERHGTYFGSFFIKDAPAVGHPGYSIDETMTATVGSALVDSSLGYISAAGAAKMNDLVNIQKQNLYANASANIVLARTKISEALRSLISTTEPSASALAQVKATVDTYSGIYGELDGENNYNYASTFYTVFNNVGGTYLTTAQKTALSALRKKYMTVTYADGVTIDFSADSKYYLYAAEVLPSSADFISYTSDSVTDPLFTAVLPTTTSTTSTTAATTTTTRASTTTTTASTTTTTASITTTTLAGTTLNFTAGWNLVGNGVEAVMTMASNFDLPSKVTTVWKWVTSGAAPGITYPAWAFYTPLQSDGGKAYAASKGYDFLSAINPGEGFWVNAQTEFTVTLPSGKAVKSSSFMPETASPAALGGAHALPHGWSLIATGDAPTPSQFDAAIATAVSTPPAAGSGGAYANLTTLWAWDSTRTGWYFWAPSLVNSSGLASYLVGKGYFDFATMPSTPTGTLSPATGFWVNMP